MPTLQHMLPNVVCTQSVGLRGFRSLKLASSISADVLWLFFFAERGESVSDGRPEAQCSVYELWQNEEKDPQTEQPVAKCSRYEPLTQW